MHWLREVVQPEDTVYDVGANIGAYSLYAGNKLRNKGGIVYAFEPAFMNFFSLCKNIQANGLNEVVIPFPLAVCSENGPETLFLSSLESGAALHGVHQAQSEGRTFSHKFIQGVYGASLSSFARSGDLRFPNHLKIDVDGYESEVIAGLGDVLESTELSSIMIEINEDTGAEIIESTLSHSGFVLAMKEEWPDKKTSNKLFVRA